MTSTLPLSLDDWLPVQLRLSATKMAECVSATSLIKRRPAFGQTVRPAKGSILAAAGSGDMDSEPDYFFHWLRDSAQVMRAALILIRNDIDADAWRERFADFVAFSLKTAQINGPRFLQETDVRSRTASTALQYLRTDREIAAIAGDAALGDVRYNADGTLDFLRWGRPQHDGPAARALTCLHVLDNVSALAKIRRDIETLLHIDLDYTLKHSGALCFDLWEEEKARHYYTLLLQCNALREGAIWARQRADSVRARTWKLAAERLEAELEAFWSPEKGFYLSRMMPPGRTTAAELDFAVILGVLHAGLSNGRHSVEDERTMQTLEQLERIFASDYAINREAGTGLAFGRYPGDRYVSGGAWFICTFGAAEFHYKCAAARWSRSKDAEFKAELISKGDAIFDIARRFVPVSGDISEQFDQTSGSQTSAKNLSWSHAAFITAWQARKDAMAITKAQE